MKRLYKVKFDQKWSSKGKRSWWADDQEVNVIGNGNIFTVGKKVQRKKLMEKFHEETVNVKWKCSEVRITGIYHLEYVDI